MAGFGVRLLGGGLGGLVHAAGVLGLAGLEAVLESAGDVLQVPRAASADGLSPLGFLTPVELAGLGGRVAAGRALMLLDVQRATTASTAQSVRLVVTLTKAGGTLRHLVGVVLGVLGVLVGDGKGKLSRCLLEGAVLDRKSVV